jgi:hypothetical protein
MSGEVTILVYAWDTYKVCWPVFCYGLAKYWQDCPYEILFITNYADPPCGKAVKVEEENDFVRKLRAGLAAVKTPYVLFMHEDYWIKKPVETKNIQDYVRLMNANQADYIRLIPIPAPDREYPEDSRLGIIDKSADYRVSFMASLWRKSVLDDLLVPGESLWQMESTGSKRSRRYGDRFLCVVRSRYGISYVMTAIRDRQWTSDARQYVKDEAITVDFSQLPAISLQKLIQYRVRSAGHRLKRLAQKHAFHRFVFRR